MTNTNIPKKPFGLTVAVKVAQEALKDNIAPTSVVISNLFYLQKSNVFPKDLDKTFFANNKYQANDLEKRAIVKLMDSLKRPQINVQEFLEISLAEGWVKKVPPKPLAKPAPIKTKAKKKPLKSAAPKKENVAPTIIVKKAKIV
jgi:hypothetical protein